MVFITGPFGATGNITLVQRTCSEFLSHLQHAIRAVCRVSLSFCFSFQALFRNLYTVRD